MKDFIQKILVALFLLPAKERDFVRNAVEPVVNLLATIKTLADSPVPDNQLLFGRVPSDAATQLLVMDTLPAALEQLGIKLPLGRYAPDYERLVRTFALHLNGKPAPMRETLLSAVARLMAKKLAGGLHLPDSVVDLLVQLAVSRLKS